MVEQSLRYFDPDLYSTFLVGPLLFFAFEKAIVPYVFQPLSISLMGVSNVKLEKGTRLYSKVMEYFPHLLFKVVMNLVEFTLWMTWLARFKGWEDWQNWAEYERPLPTTHEEYEPTKKIYYVYFVFVIFTTLKDIWRRPANAGIAQYSFDLHHLLALFLTAASLSTGLWRAGMLTRVSHGITDVILYGSKVGETYLEVQQMLQKEPKPYFLQKLFFLSFASLAWILTRIIVYAVVCWSYTVLYTQDIITNYPKHQPIALSLVIGSLLMYLLQLVWLFGLTITCMKFFKSGGKIRDFNHAHHDQLEKEKNKKKQ